jgi:EAL domain-containing protein (putative c-di-GMP-specific phosphodiesterase class I)
MVERLIADLERWDRKTLPGWISLNLGLTSLGAPSFRRWLGDLIRDELLPGVRLVLDISERTAIRNPELVGNVLSALEGLPVSLALDDFGTGHGSVAFLEQTPMTLVKVDSSFLRDPEQRGEVGALVRALVGLGHAVGMEVGLEGVERRTQYEAFGRDGPDFLQGYYTGAPVEPGRFTTYSDAEAR